MPVLLFTLIPALFFCFVICHVLSSDLCSAIYLLYHSSFCLPCILPWFLLWYQPYPYSVLLLINHLMSCSVSYFLLRSCSSSCYLPCFLFRSLLCFLMCFVPWYILSFLTFYMFCFLSCFMPCLLSCSQPCFLGLYPAIYVHPLCPTICPAI